MDKKRRKTRRTIEIVIWTVIALISVSISIYHVRTDSYLISFYLLYMAIPIAVTILLLYSYVIMPQKEELKELKSQLKFIDDKITAFYKETINQIKKSSRKPEPKPRRSKWNF